ncbi:anti-sigma factor RsiW [Paenibacillus rhizosphaerae]|uniref:Anti-sigma-W factor RsiW n=1 Tax=Paenibacillus rhizosphaerae TaxID=297318 RepID=A0A839TKD6_9BACL|nr:zf-HC2 domain-containing protein [Paenibacillus rhizosphaerae]MBB3127264.1 anti-sigma factor RsiW [Paenibacillus rhizosphaerae]
MKCPEVVEWMHRYLDYDLDEEETVKLYEHLKTCPECADTFRLLKSLSRDLEDLPKVTPKFSLVDAIMPQLDAIDQARHEKSASLEEMPASAEMVPVPSRPARKGKFWNTVAGRTALGGAAAVVILGVAVLNYNPKQLSTAEEPPVNTAASSEASSMDSAATSGSEASKSNVVEQDAGSSEPAQDPSEGQTPASTDSSQLSESQDAGSDAAASDKAAGQEAQTYAQKQDLSNTPAQDPEISRKTDTGSQDDAGKAGSTESADNSTGMQEGDGGQAALNAPADTESTPPKQDDVQKDIAPPDGDGGQAADSTAPEVNGSQEGDTSEQMGIMAIKPKEDSNKLYSPDGQYAASVENKKLVIYSLTSDGSSKQVSTLDLPGTWVSGVWSADSTVFTYQTTDASGATVSQTYQVGKQDGSTP